MYSKLQDAIISTINMFNASLICTTLNEEGSIAQFIDSITTQLVLPDETIIVDGGSKDKTVGIIKTKIKQYPKLKLKLFVKKGNRSTGRNEAIKKTSGKIILCSDAGCKLDKNWTKNIIAPFADKKVSVVAGYYKGTGRNIFQKCLVPYVLVMPDKVDKNNFLPATRSMAFSKTVWTKLKGFDEKLSHNEDYAFANKIKEAGFKIFFQKSAIVNWFPPKNIFKAFNMFFRFSLGDIQANIIRKKVVFIFLRYLLALLLIVLSVITSSIYLYSTDAILIIVYVAWAIWKNYKYVKSATAFLYLPLLQFLSDFAVMSGALIGLFQKLYADK